MEVDMGHACVVQPCGQNRQARRQPLADLGTERLRVVVESLFKELVQGNGSRNLPGDQVVLEEEVSLSLFTQGDGMDGRYADRREDLGPLALVATLAPAKPLAPHGAVVGHEVVLDVDRTLGKIDPGDDPRRATLSGEDPRDRATSHPKGREATSRRNQSAPTAIPGAGTSVASPGLSVPSLPWTS